MSGRSKAGLVAALAILAGLAWLSWERLQNRLAVENESGQPLALLRVEIAGEAIDFRDVPAGGRGTASFRIKADDHLVVAGRLADGTAIRGEFGYVSNGMSGQRVRLVIKPGGEVAFEQAGGIGPF